MTRREIQASGMAALEARQALHRREPSDWTHEELRGELVHRYAPTAIPPCRMCGAELSLTSFGGGEPPTYACDGREETADGAWRWKEGRQPADKHYRLSEFRDARHGGDAVVLEALSRLDRLSTECGRLAKLGGRLARVARIVRPAVHHHCTSSSHEAVNLEAALDEWDRYVLEAAGE